jgi:hypothetical protein
MVALEHWLGEVQDTWRGRTVLARLGRVPLWPEEALEGCSGQWQT